MQYVYNLIIGLINNRLSYTSGVGKAIKKCVFSYPVMILMQLLGQGVVSIKLCNVYNLWLVILFTVIFPKGILA
jgi:hypothetical protein